jgi:hypothetical protein
MVAMSRFIDERGRIFGKVNVVDILVLLVIVAVVVFAVVRLSGGGTDTRPLKVTFIAKELRNEEADSVLKWVKPGDNLVDESGTVLGKVQSVVAEATLVEYFTSTDIPQQFPSTILKDVKIVVRGQGSVSGHSARIGGTSVLRLDKVIVVVGTTRLTTLVNDLVWGEEALK